MNILIGIIMAVITFVGANLAGPSLGTPSQVQTSDTINTLRTTVNELVSNYVPSSSIPSATTILGSTYIGVSTSNGTSTITNNGVQTVTGGTGISVSSATGTPTITNIGVTSIVAGSSTIVSNATGTVTIGQRSKSCQWTAVYTSSSNAWGDDFCIFDTTSTIKSVWVKQQTNADFLTFNLYYSNTMPATTSTGAFKVLSADQTITATTTAKLSTFASSTPRVGDFLRIYAYNASSTEFTMQVYYDEN